ncbi:hypothetical protein L5M28_20985 [Shewanella sp. SW32]|uniref:hypothetical protein n=1 Tax=Shewanella TaxID=22 RepID=UPI0021D911BE|nr:MULTISPECIES: hypothetical protein [unclassified Shewanella]MCU7965031.1 hypothetical protein [Shewanella sp. SW32]MCU7973019.1 hypothetical protein [Shewanella sp. SW29]
MTMLKILFPIFLLTPFHSCQAITLLTGSKAVNLSPSKVAVWLANNRNKEINLKVWISDTDDFTKPSDNYTVNIVKNELSINERTLVFIQAKNIAVHDEKTAKICIYEEMALTKPRLTIMSME